MSEVLYSLDISVFHFLNGSIANPVFDLMMPFLTDLNKTLFGRALALVVWGVLFWKGGKKGRVVALMLIPLIALSDQLSSTFVKKLICRARPCHLIDGVSAVANVRLLVDCGSGFSFPSSHAVNNIAAATYFSFFYRKWTWAFFTFGGLVALSRVYVGVHYPSDLLGGALLGALCAALIIALWSWVASRYKTLRLDAEERPVRG